MLQIGIALMNTLA